MHICVTKQTDSHSIVQDRRFRQNVDLSFPCLLFSGPEQFNGSDEADGFEAHQLREGEDDDDAQNWSEI